MESFSTTSRNTKYHPALNPNSFYQNSTYSRNFRQNDYNFPNSTRNSTLLWQERPNAPPPKSKGKLCSIALAAAAFIVLVIVLSIAGLALYMGALRTESPSPLVSYSCSAKILRGDRFTTNLPEKARRYKLQFEALYQRSVLGPSIVSCSVEKFGNDTLTIYYKIILNRRKIPRHIYNVEKSLKDILISDALTRKPIFRNVRFDSRSINIKQTSEADSYQKVITKSKEIPKPRPGVLLKTPSKVNNTATTTTTTTTTEQPIKKRPVMDEVEIKEDDLPVIQGSFKISKTEADITEKRNTSEHSSVQKPKSTTTPSPQRRSTLKETSITSALFKLASGDKSSRTTTVSTIINATVQIIAQTTAPTTHTTPVTPVESTTNTKSSSNTKLLNPFIFSLNPSIFNQEPWIPIYKDTPTEPSLNQYNLPPSIQNVGQIDVQPVYTSFTNPGLTYHQLDSEKLGSTKVQGHPIPVDKIYDSIESTSQYTTESILNKATTETPTIDKRHDEVELHDLHTLNDNSSDESTSFIEIKTIKAPENGKTESLKPISTSNATRLNQTNYNLKELSVLKNISSLFHSLASTLESSSTKTTVNGNAEKSTTATMLENKTDNLGEGLAEVIDADEISLMMQTTKVPLVTLLPVKSNSGVGRPIRPRPKTEYNSNFELRKFNEAQFPEIITTSTELNKIKPNSKHELADFKIVSILNFATEIANAQSSTVAASLPEFTIDNNNNNNNNNNYETTTIEATTLENSFEDEVAILSMNSSVTSQIDDGVQYLSPEKLKKLSEISKLSNNDTQEEDGIISTKAVSSSYSINHSGFKILTKTFNKVPSSFKESSVTKGAQNAIHFSVTNRSECSNFTIKCGDGQCLPNTTRCNQLVDCNDGSDEKDCNCADYLRSQFLLRKICDGIVDCWDFSDENNCEWCKPGQYVCGNSKICINSTNICDGIHDCPHGDDERQCVTVAPTINAADEFPYQSEGYLMVRKHGRWGKLCIENFKNVVSKSHTAWEVSDLGQAVCKSMTYQSLEHVKIINENKLKNIHRNAQYYELSYSFQNETKSSLTFENTSCKSGEVVRVKCQTLECGARPQAIKHIARIVGGGNAGLGAWPWQAALYKEGEFQCGATLISNKWLLSAGHCFYHSLKDHWVARLGALRRGTALPSPYEQLRPIIEIILHPGYVDVGFINDISLLKMEFPVIFSDYVRPICLPPAGVAPRDGRICTVVGWGQLFEIGRIFPDTLQEVQVPVISTAECRKKTLFLPLYRVTDDMFCAGYDRGGRDACLGDSGGPLMCPESDGRWVLHGITSNGYGCARANRPGVYTKVSNYLQWIHFHINNNDSKNSTETIKSTCAGHRCPLGECLPKSRLCNGFIECSDGSDESGCISK